ILRANQALSFTVKTSRLRTFWCSLWCLRFRFGFRCSFSARLLGPALETLHQTGAGFWTRVAVAVRLFLCLGSFVVGFHGLFFVLCCSASVIRPRIRAAGGSSLQRAPPVWAP